MNESKSIGGLWQSFATGGTAPSSKTIGGRYTTDTYEENLSYPRGGDQLNPLLALLEQHLAESSLTDVVHLWRQILRIFDFRFRRWVPGADR